jgi:hypothetical protein
MNIQMKKFGPIKKLRTWFAVRILPKELRGYVVYLIASEKALRALAKLDQHLKNEQPTKEFTAIH